MDRLYFGQDQILVFLGLMHKYLIKHEANYACFMPNRPIYIEWIMPFVSFALSSNCDLIMKLPNFGVGIFILYETSDQSRFFLPVTKISFLWQEYCYFSSILCFAEIYLVLKEVPSIYLPSCSRNFLRATIEIVSFQFFLPPPRYVR